MTEKLSRRSGYVLRWGPVVAGMAAIFAVSAQSQPPVPEGMSNTTGHVLAYAGLGVLIVRAVAGALPARVTRRVALVTMAIAVGYGATDELHQWFVPGRVADVGDVIADAAGALIAVAVCWAWGIIRLPNRGSGRRVA